METLSLLLVAVLIALTAFFVASEFAIVKVRSSRINQLVAEGRKGALAAQNVTTHLDEYLSACQLGITVTAIGLGALAKPAVESLLLPLFGLIEVNEALSHILSFAIAFISINYLHVVVGEMVPKTVAIQKAEQVTLIIANPLIWFYKIMYPFIWVLNGSARILVRMFGLKPASEHELAHSEEELRMLLSDSYKSGEINQNELKYLNNIFEFDERLAKEIMIPRTEIVCLSIHDTMDELKNALQNENYTRYPVIDGDKDNIIGFINIKEYLTAAVINGDHKKLDMRHFINPVIHVLETTPIHQLLVKMQKERTHIAILIDEYGGTSGLVTLEDIVEEIVGEIRDEFDSDEIPEIRKVRENHYILDGKVLIEDVNSLLGINLSFQGIDTIGGWFLSQKIDADQGTELEAEGYMFKVKKIEGHHILFLEVKKKKI